LERLAAEPSFWDDPELAQRTMRELSSLREEVSLWQGMEHRVRDMVELLRLAEEEAGLPPNGDLRESGVPGVQERDESLIREIEHDAAEVQAELERLEFQLMFSGPHDRSDAILAIHAGAGGTDSQDWAEMLMRMYLRWAEMHHFKAEIVDTLAGEEAGLKRAMLSVEGRYAYGYLRSERGVHRLVRLSPFDANHRRHTSFALVEVWPDIQEEITIDIRPDDIEIETFASSGPGGQHMQKNATAVRVTHKPTNIVVSCQSERSQTQNRDMAMKVLRARLYELETERQRAEREELRGEHVEAGWGNQIRSYVLHPYRMVKDLRTGYEVGDTDAVLDGNLDGFMEAYLRHMVGEEVE
jgi:peptide chain release factor 2